MVDNSRETSTTSHSLSKKDMKLEITNMLLKKLSLTLLENKIPFINAMKCFIVAHGI